MTTAGRRRRVDTRCIACRARLILRPAGGGRSWTAAQAAELERGTFCGDCAGPYTMTELAAIGAAWRADGTLPPRLAAIRDSESGLTRDGAARKLTALGFSQSDIPRILATARRPLGGGAQGLTSDYHVNTSCRNGRYSVRLRTLIGCRCGYCVMTGRYKGEEKEETMTPNISRSTGIPVEVGGVFYGMAGGGYRGVTDELDAVVQRAAGALTMAYGGDVEIRFNSDRGSGGAFLVTPDGRNADVGICADLVTARQRMRWQRHAEEDQRMAETGRNSWDGGPMTDDARAASAELAAEWRRCLTDNPEGQLTVFAHITAAVAGDRADELAQLPGWNEFRTKAGDGSYHRGAAESADDALARCLRFAPPAAARQEQEDR
jgi:hypothetical protein